MHCFEQALADVVHPASEKEPKPTHERPAPQSESELQSVPADLSGVLLHVRKGISRAKNKVTTRTFRIVLYSRTRLRTWLVREENGVLRHDEQPLPSPLCLDPQLERIASPLVT